jgi:hypothetical protein
MTAGRAAPDRSVLASIEFLLCDVDGVLTDGRVHFDRDGQEYKSLALPGWYAHRDTEPLADPSRSL